MYTRSDCTFLFRAFGDGNTSETSSFTDVNKGAYYYDGVSWAVKSDITSGTGNGKFSPDAPCTRGQVVTFLYRAAGSPSVSGASSFSDVKRGSFYVNAVNWAVQNNVTSGTGNGKFSPDAPCTRGQVVTFLYRSRNIISKKAASGNLSDLNETNEELQSQIFSKDITDETAKKNHAQSVLNDFASEGKIKENSVYYNDDSQSFTFIYSSGVLGVIQLKEFDSDKNGTDGNTFHVNTTDSISDFSDVSFSPSYALSVGTAVDLWSFAQAWDIESFRRPFYQKLDSDWDEKGLDTTVNYDTTVNSYKNLSGHNVIVFSGHGGYGKFYFPNTDSIESKSYLITHDVESDLKDENYEDDLLSNRVGISMMDGVSVYIIYPEFFTYYYGSDGLDGTFIYAENCEFYGNNSNVDNAMANSLVNCGAEAVVGFRNSVNADYSRDLMNLYVSELIKGETAGDALDAAKAERGQNDSGNPAAYAIFTGNKDAKLVDHAGDIQKAYDYYSSVLRQARTVAESDTDNYLENYYLADLNQDGIPELILKCGTAEAFYHGDVYTWHDGAGKELSGDTLGLGHGSLYTNSDYDGILVTIHYMGNFFMVDQVTMENDTLKVTTLYRCEGYNELEEEPEPEYVKWSNIESSSQDLRDYGRNVSLPKDLAS